MISKAAKAKSTGRTGVTQAKVIRANGTTEYHYSIPTLPWWAIKQRRWVRRRLADFRSQENT